MKEIIVCNQCGKIYRYDYEENNPCPNCGFRQISELEIMLMQKHEKHKEMFENEEND